MDVAHGIGSQTNNPEGGAGSVSRWLHTHAIPTTRHAPATPAQTRRLLSRGTRGAGGGSAGARGGGGGGWGGGGRGYGHGGGGHGGRLAPPGSSARPCSQPCMGRVAGQFRGEFVRSPAVAQGPLPARIPARPPQH